ncbi:hypothetical protein J2T14_005071 [Paenibacillus harenae]|nr:hypothetical protein [Paenibacillus harenae]
MRPLLNGKLAVIDVILLAVIALCMISWID